MSNEIEKAKTVALAVPAGMEDFLSSERSAGVDEGRLGNEGIGRDDVAMPRIAIAQKTSPEIDPTSPRYISGLQFTDLFNSATKQIYGKGPIYFSILRRDDPRFIEFKPLEEGGGIVDMNVLAGDSRTKFTSGPNGESIKPIATKFYDYVVLLLNNLDLTDPLPNVVAMSLKSSGIKAAKHLNMLINMRGKKMLYKGAYKLTTGSDVDKKTQGSFAIYKYDNAGWMKEGSPVERLAGELFKAWEDKELVIEREPGSDDEFVPENLEHAPATADM